MGQQQRRTAALSLCWAVVVIGVLVSTVCSASRHHGGPGRDGGGGRRGRESLAADGGDSKDSDVRSAGVRETMEAGKHVLLHEAVRKLLGFPSSSPTPGRRRQHRALLLDPRAPPPMPKYVLDLYEKYRSGEISQGPTIGNTIRSIPAEIGEVNGEAMFIFNLSSIAPTERVLRAHVHLYKRKSTARKRRLGKRAETELVLYEVAPHYLSQTGTIIMRASSWGWQWYGATESVLSCLLADRQHPHLFALSFRAEKPNGKTRTLALKRFVRHHSLPFLILYSNETESVNLEELDIVAERLKQREGDELMEQPENTAHGGDGEENLDDSEDSEEEVDENDFDDDDEGDADDDNESDVDEDDKNDVNGDDSDSAESDIENDEDSFEEIQNNIQEGKIKNIFEISEAFGDMRSHRKRHRNNRKLDKKKRNHKNKQLDDDDNNLHSKTEQSSDVQSLLELHEGGASEVTIEQAPTDSLSPSGQRKKRSILTNEIPEDPADYLKFHYRFNLPQTHPGMLTARKESRHKLEDRRLIPYPPNRGSSKRRRRKHQKRKQRKQNRKNRRKILLPERWEDYHDNLASPDNNPSQLCSRRHLVVDFADIGWGDWIISPKSFEAHYCAGTCPFPLTKRLRPSNHATIQSIVNAIGLYSNVPAPCCVPDAMSSVTLLYFDENRNVVLKNYPGMSVQSCACR